MNEISDAAADFGPALITAVIVLAALLIAAYLKTLHARRAAWRKSEEERWAAETVPRFHRDRRGEGLLTFTPGDTVGSTLVMAELLNSTRSVASQPHHRGDGIRPTSAAAPQPQLSDD
jgi:hypothetical protein